VEGNWRNREGWLVKMFRWVVLYLAGFAFLAFLALLNRANWANAQLAMAVLLIMGLAILILLRKGKTGGRKR
jgi:hypothetical protein